LLVGSLSFYVDINDYKTVLPFEKLLKDAATLGFDISYILLTTPEAVPKDNCNLNYICFH
jgi:hypothetical protein